MQSGPYIRAFELQTFKDANGCCTSVRRFAAQGLKLQGYTKAAAAIQNAIHGEKKKPHRPDITELFASRRWMELNPARNQKP
ncbi:unnamed protein product [Rangifer tarandus platyrhynchus]|uniref:Uncharacterized protein n=2 Tax=Rangifer tarandus platyrhynchus TaxID=3082113 RepID=A0ABN8ZIE5_RANTA|nr:unnamed protein product [Rangifer tarandus platyrhynchus]CAI9709261.1 unnamed protein product [Rangifer tarandus platyrhynchus]